MALPKSWLKMNRYAGYILVAILNLKERTTCTKKQEKDCETIVTCHIWISPHAAMAHRRVEKSSRRFAARGAAGYCDISPIHRVREKVQFLETFQHQIFQEGCAYP